MDKQGNRVQEKSQNKPDRIVKDEARKMLAQLLDNDVEDYIQKHKYTTDLNGHGKGFETLNQRVMIYSDFDISVLLASSDSLSVNASNLRSHKT